MFDTFCIIYIILCRPVIESPVSSVNTPEAIPKQYREYANQDVDGAFIEFPSPEIGFSSVPEYQWTVKNMMDSSSARSTARNGHKG